MDTNHSWHVRNPNRPFTDDSPIEAVFGRESDAEDLTQRLLVATGGAFLVTGFRGVGKTTFVQLVTRLLEREAKRFGDRDQIRIVDVWLNLARPLTPAQLMHYLIRNLYLRLQEKEVLSLLTHQLLQDLKIAFFRTSFEISSRNLTTEERERSSSVGFDKASLLGLEFMGQIGAKYSRSQSDEELLKYLPYDEKAAEFDLIRFSRELSSRFAVKESRFARIKRRFLRQRPSTCQVKVLFVLDELDKLERFRDRDGHPLDELLEALKSVFSASNFSYVFIGGQELHERWMRDVALGDSIYESIFAYDIYLPCLWDDQERIVNEFIAEQGVGTEFDKEQLRQFALFLRYKGRGIPRRIVREGSKHFNWTTNGVPALSLNSETRRYVSVLAKLEEILQTAVQSGRHFGRFADLAVLDRLRLRMYYVLDWLLFNQSHSFSTNDLNERIGELNLGKRAGTDDDLGSRIIQLLTDRAFIEPIESTVVGPRNEVGKYRLATWVIRALENFSGGSQAWQPTVQEATTSRNPFASEDVPQGDASRSPGSFTREFLSSEVSSKTTLGGYSIKGILGQGGFATVYKVADSKGQFYAAKVLNESFAAGSTARDRFQREIEILKRVDDERIVRIYGSGETDDGRPYFIMDLVQGRRLDRVLKGGPLTIRKVLSIGKELTEAYGYLHSLGMIRNDIKPANVFLLGENDVRIVDLGTVKSAIDPNITSEGILIGTLKYMSPEALNAQTVDARSDVFCLALLLYELLVGFSPFEAPEFGAIARKIISDDPVPPSRLAQVPEEFDRVLLHALSKNPDLRFQSMQEFRTSLESIPFEDTEVEMQSESIREDSGADFGTKEFVPDPKLAERLHSQPSDADAALHSSDVRIRLEALRKLQTQDGNTDHLLFDFVINVCYFTAEGSGPVPLTKGRILIGRDPANDFVISEPHISRQHLAFIINEDNIAVEDLASETGIRINGSTATRQQVHDGDLLQLGARSIRIHVHLHQPKSSP